MASLLECKVYKSAIYTAWVRNPFRIEPEDMPEDTLNINYVQEELIHLQNDETLHLSLKNKMNHSFYSGLKCPKKKILGNEAMKALLPFATTYLCEEGFSALTVVKTKYRN